MPFKLKEKAAGAVMLAAAAVEDAVTPAGAADAVDAVAVMAAAGAAAGAVAVGVDPVFAAGSVRFGFARNQLAKYLL